MSAASHTTVKFDLYQTVTDRIIELLEQGVIPWRKPWSSAGPPMNGDSKRPYSGINVWLLMALPYESNLYLTFNQVRYLGGCIKPGEKGHLVVYWKTKERIDIETSAEEVQKIYFPSYHNLFNVEQCTNLPAYATESDYERKINPVAACEVIVQSMPNRPEIRFDKSEAFYHSIDDYINMPTMKRFDDSERYYSSLFHEMVHSTGHKSRLNRKGVSEMVDFGSEDYSFEELVAELGSCFLCSHVGIEQKVLRNQAGYIQAWLDKLKNDSRLMISASSEAQKAVDFILCKRDDVTLIGPTVGNRA